MREQFNLILVSFIKKQIGVVICKHYDFSFSFLKMSSPDKVISGDQWLRIFFWLTVHSREKLDIPWVRFAKPTKIWLICGWENMIVMGFQNPPVWKPIWIALQEPRQLLWDVFNSVDLVNFRLPKRFCVQVVDQHLQAVMITKNVAKGLRNLWHNNFHPIVVNLPPIRAVHSNYLLLIEVFEGKVVVVKGGDAPPVLGGSDL